MDNATTHDGHDQENARAQNEHVEERDGEDDDGVPAPFAPDPDDDSPLGDTDEHSDA